MQVTHTYPQAFDLAGAIGPDAVLVLHALLSEARWEGAELVSTVSLRDIAEKLGRVSKDTVHRRLREIRRAGLIRVLPPTVSTTTTPTYAIDITNTGISITTTRPIQVLSPELPLSPTE